VLRDDNGANYLPLKIVIGVAGRRHKSGELKAHSVGINKQIAGGGARARCQGRAAVKILLFTLPGILIT